MSNISPYSNGLIITYNEEEVSLERVLLPFVDNLEDKLHQVIEEETLRSIAHDYYGDGREWYKIADRNELDDIFTLVPGSTLIIPKIVKNAR